jgi:hypothetical protein
LIDTKIANAFATQLDDHLVEWLQTGGQVEDDGDDGPGNIIWAAVGKSMGLERRRMRKEIASAAEEVRRDIADKLVALRERTVEMVATRPAYNQDRADLAIERAAAKLRDEFGDKVAALERGFKARLADLEGRLHVPREMPIAKVWAPDSAALVGELYTHAGSSWQARRNTGQTPGGDHWLCLARGGEVIEGDDASALDQRLGDTRREIREEVAEEQARMVNRIEAMIAAAEARMVDALASQPAFDPGQTGCVIETAVARVREESDRALEAQKRELAAQLQALRERLGDEVSRRSFDQGQIERAAAAAAEIAVAPLRVGLDDVVEVQARAFDARLADLEARLMAIPGKLPIARAWKPQTVAYAGSFVVHDGSAWQATKDTATRPGDGDDWICVAPGGRNGCDGKSIALRGPFDLRERYSALDTITHEGQSFIAVCDNPTGIPGTGNGWLLIAARGVKGEKGALGPRGHRGDRGPNGAKLHSWRIDKEGYRVSPLFEDGSVGPKLNLRELFALYQEQTS